MQSGSYDGMVDPGLGELGRNLVGSSAGSLSKPRGEAINFPKISVPTHYLILRFCPSTA